MGAHLFRVDGQPVPGQPWPAFVARAVRERIIAVNPVSGTRVPPQSTAPVEMQPFTTDELSEVRGQDRIAPAEPVGRAGGARFLVVR